MLVCRNEWCCDSFGQVLLLLTRGVIAAAEVRAAIARIDGRIWIMFGILLFCIVFEDQR